MSRHTCSPVSFPEIGSGAIPQRCSGGLPLPRDELNDAKKTSSTSSITSVTDSAKTLSGSRKTASSEKSRGSLIMGRTLMKLKKKKHLKYLKSRLPVMNELEIKQITYSVKHFLFFDLLQDGFHATHAKLYEITKQLTERTKLGHKNPPLETQGDLLCVMARHLMQIETAKRINDHQVVYAQYVILAEIVIDRDPQELYTWLSDHFYFCSMDAAMSVGMSDGGHVLAEASLNVGTVFESRNKLLESAEQFEHYRELAMDNEVWLVPGKGREVDPYDIRLMANDSCVQLARVYEKLAQIAADVDHDFETSYQYYVKVYDSVKKGGGRKMFLEATRKLAYAAELNSDSETALLHLNLLLESYCIDGDTEGVARTLEVIAMSHKSLRQVDESIAYYAEFTAMCEQLDDYGGVKRACNETGHLYNITGKYDIAASYFTKGYSVYEPATNCAVINTMIKSRVFFGIGRGHQMLHKYGEHIRRSTAPCMERIFDWKDTRHNELMRAIPERLSGIPREKRRREHYRLEYERQLEEKRRVAELHFARMSTSTRRRSSASGGSSKKLPQPKQTDKERWVVRLPSAELNSAFRRKSNVHKLR